MKRCNVCDQEKPATQEYFYTRFDRPDRCTYTCKTCTDARNTAYKNTPKGREVSRRAAKKSQSGRRYQNNVLHREYGISLEDYEKMIDNQGGHCVLCGGVNPDGRKLAVDHDHETKRVRGLLCLQCNRLLGVYEKLLRQCGEKRLKAYLLEAPCPES